MEVCCDQIYAPLVSHLESWGFSQADGTLVLFAYDWRKSAVDTAQRLAELIGNISQRSPAPSVVILAHSLGGLAARYYLESGDFSPDPTVTQLILMATPNLGAPDALVTRMGGAVAVPTVSSDEVRQLADDQHYPSAYQLFPPGAQRFAFDDSDSGKQIDVYDPANGLMPTSINRDAAVAFQAKLDPSKRGKVEYFCFYGQHYPTYDNTYLTRDAAGGFELDMDRTNNAQKPGDDTVPTWSAQISGVASDGSSAAPHEKIFQDDDLLRVLASKLGKPEQAAMIPSRVQVFVSRRALASGKEASPVIKFPKEAGAIRGELRLEKVDPVGRRLRVMSRQNVDRANVSMAQLPVTIPIPKTAGSYRLLFQRKDRSQADAQETFYIPPSERVRQRVRRRTTRKTHTPRPKRRN
jgi:hypothetical protein